MSGRETIRNWLERWGLHGPILVGLILKVLWVVFCPNLPSSDQAIYHHGAINILAGNGFVTVDGSPEAFWPAGYSAILVPFYWAIGPVPFAASVANLFLSLATSIGAALLIGDLWGRRASEIGSWILALHPSLILYTTCTASENAFLVGTVWFALAALRAGAGKKAWGWLVVASIAFSLTLHVRGTILLLLPLAPVVFLLQARPWRTFVSRGLVFILVSGLLMIPWSLRNQEEFGKFTPLSLNGSSNLWMGNHEGATGGYAPLPAKVDDLPIVEREKLLGDEAKAFILDDPVRYLGLCIRRTFDTLKTDTIGVVWNAEALRVRGLAFMVLPLKALSTFVHWLLLSLACYFMVRLFNRPVLNEAARTSDGYWTGSYWVSLFALVALALPFVMIVSGNRYHLPLIPFVTSMVAAGLSLQLKEDDGKVVSSESIGSPHG